KARSRASIATGQPFGTVGHRFLDLLVHAVQNLFGREWPDLGRFVKWIAHFQRAHLLDELLQKTVVNFVGDEKSFRRDTRLAGVDRARFDGSSDRKFEIGAWHDDERIAATELEHGLFNFAR